MKNINENINRLRQIMSYDRSRGLLINESQYSIEDSVELSEQEDNAAKRAESIAKQIYAACKGMGTDESQLIDAIKDIDNSKLFYTVDEFLKGYDYGNETEGFEYYINDELGVSDMDVVESIVRHLEKINIKSKYDTSSNGKVFVNNTFKLMGDSTDEPIKDTPISDKEESDSVCPTIEELKTGKKFLKVDGKNENCDAIVLVQKKLISEMLKLGLPVTEIKGDDLGNYGKKTSSMLAAYQNFKELKVDGIVGPKTMSSLGF